MFRAPGTARRIHRPISPPTPPRMNGTRQPHDCIASSVRLVVRPQPSAEATRMPAARLKNTKLEKKPRRLAGAISASRVVAEA